MPEKTERINIRIKPDIKQLALSRANELGLSLSAYVVMLIEQDTTFIATPEERDVFKKILGR